MSDKNTPTSPSEWITQEEAAVILGLENPTSVSHIESPGGAETMKAVPKLYSRAQAERIAKARAEKKAADEAEKAKEAAEAEAKKDEPEVERHEPANELPPKGTTRVIA
jgi:hypothetical protein